MDDDDVSYRIEASNEKQVVDITFFTKTVAGQVLYLEQHMVFRHGAITVDSDPTELFDTEEPVRFEFYEDPDLRGPGATTFVNLDELPEEERALLAGVVVPEDAGWAVDSSIDYIMFTGEVDISAIAEE